LRNAAAGAAGFVAGYAPAILFNLTHHLSNWQFVFAGKTSTEALLHPATIVEILFDEMPKFFGFDTTLWYYPETPAIGYVSYAIAVAAVVAALVPFLTRPSRLRDAWRGEPAGRDEHNDLVLVLLTLACFVPYVVAPVRIPGYFLGGCFFLAVLSGRLAARCLASPTPPRRLLGVAVVGAAALAGCVAMVETGRHNQIETLTLDAQGRLDLARFPGTDIEAVERHLLKNKTEAAWTTVSFVYPLLFESNETLAISDAIFGWGRPVYPAAVPRREPAGDQRQVFVLETSSPFRAAAAARCAQAAHAPPLVTGYGTLTVIEERPQR
jgi:hypothetical protein